MNNSAINLSDVKTIDIQAKEWFDKTYGNSYFAALCTINYGMETQTSFFIPFHYGYGTFYQDCANREIEKMFGIKENSIYWKFYAENNIIVRYSKQENCKKRDLKQENFR